MKIKVVSSKRTFYHWMQTEGEVGSKGSISRC